MSLARTKSVKHVSRASKSSISNLKWHIWSLIKEMSVCISIENCDNWGDDWKWRDHRCCFPHYKPRSVQLQCESAVRLRFDLFSTADELTRVWINDNEHVVVSPIECPCLWNLIRGHFNGITAPASLVCSKKNIYSIKRIFSSFQRKVHQESYGTSLSRIRGPERGAYTKYEQWIPVE